MIYQYVKRYLKNNYSPNCSAIHWSNLDNIKFFSYIDQRYTLEEFAKDIIEVKTAFKDFFESSGKIIFRYKEESNLKFKILPYSVHPKDSKHLKNIIKIILHNRKYILYPYQNQTDQIALLGKIRREINREIFDSDESVNKRELIKYAIRTALELDDKDVVTQLKRKYIVKIFKKNKILKAGVEAPKKREGKANRFNGYTEEEIAQTYKRIFINGNVDIKYFLNTIMKKLFIGDLNFRVISNKFYEENALKLIYSEIENELFNYVSLEKDYLLGLTGYIMRKYFQNIHELMATELIECIYEKNANANQFLLYYNGGTILRNNRKYKIPSLETADGQQWNNASLIGICNLWMNTKKKQEQFEHKLIETNEKISQLEDSLKYIRPEIDVQETSITKIKGDLAIAEKEHSEMETKLKYLEKAYLNSEEYFKEKKAIKESEQILKKLRISLRDADKKLAIIKSSNLSIYTELDFFTEQKQKLLHDIEAQHLNINSKRSQIDPILHSVAKVLMQRTKKVTA